MLKKSAVLSCSFGLFGLSGLIGWIRLTGRARQLYRPDLSHTCGSSKFKRGKIVFPQPARRGLPGPERTAIEMDELRARIKPYPTVLQPQRGMANLTKLDTGNIEVERLPLDM